MKPFLMLQILSLSALFVTACSSVPKHAQDVEIGMSKKQVLSIMGSPDSDSKGSSYELLNYVYTESFGVRNSVYIMIDDGKVSEVGQGGRRVVARPVYIAPQAPTQAYVPPIKQPLNCTSRSYGNTTQTSCN